MSTKGQPVTINIPAGGVQPINVEGKNFQVIFSPVDLEIKMPDAGFGIYQQGSGIEDLPNGETFKRLEVRNPSLGAITAVIWIGGPLYRDSRTNVIEPKTALLASPVVTIANAAGVAFSGIGTGSQIRRKAFQVTNLDPAANLQIRDAAGNVALTVFAQTSVTLPVSEYIQVWNASGGPVAVNMSETWWTL